MHWLSFWQLVYHCIHHALALLLTTRLPLQNGIISIWTCAHRCVVDRIINKSRKVCPWCDFLNMFSLVMSHITNFVSCNFSPTRLIFLLSYVFICALVGVVGSGGDRPLFVFATIVERLIAQVCLLLGLSLVYWITFTIRVFDALPCLPDLCFLFGV